MNNGGYRPWVARKPPLFYTSLSTTYIKLSSAALIAIPVLIVGLLSGLALSKINADIIPLTKTKLTIESTGAIETAINLLNKTPDVSAVQNTHDLTVPAIPSIQTNPISEPVKELGKPTTKNETQSTESPPAIIVQDSKGPIKKQKNKI